jgi:hypothetical protein
MSTFFRQYSDFAPRDQDIIQVEFGRLCAHLRINVNTKRAKKLKNEAYNAEFDRFYPESERSHLSTWRDLCADVGVDIPRSITHAKKVSESHDGLMQWREELMATA